MYYSLFGRCRSPRSRTCNCYPGPCNQQNPPPVPCKSPSPPRCPHKDTGGGRHGDLLIKCAAFGGLILPEGTEKGATYHVASLNLDTSRCRDFLVQLDFSCNVIADGLEVRLRFQLLKQEKSQCFSVPVCTGLLYQRDSAYSEANTITLSACDCDATVSTCCCYNVIVEIEEFEAGGCAIIANPVLIATIVNRN